MSGSLSSSEKRELITLLQERQRRKNQNKLATYRPYAKQRAFHESGRSFRERLFMAGNQLGKTWAGGFEVAMHLTGRYPDWWQGIRFDRPINMWAASETMEVSRDGMQRILLGRVSERGTGAIPGDAILETPSYPNVPDAVSLVKVRHVSGGISTCTFKSYDQGRRKFQADTLDLIWFDEEPPEEIYTEGITRTNASGGPVIVTFTPLKGMSRVVARFLLEESQDRTVVNMTIDDAEHYTPEQRATIIASYPAHEREARTKGTPTLGSGRIFPVAEEVVKCEPFKIPAHWVRICGLDFGWDHPTAAAWLAWDRDNDVLYIYDVYRQKEQTPVVHAAAIKARGAWVPVAWPHDGLQHDKGSGEQLAEQYRQQGVAMLPQRATFEDGTNGVEAGLLDMLDRMQTGRLKVFSHLAPWFEEFRLYHREDGRVVKLMDDIMSATRYAVMMVRHAVTEKPPIEAWREKLNRLRASGRSHMSS
ncbi:terminase large subunit domain-containing protein [Chitiniphilus shinanonensis]|uniref:terminase large subunit domain-containing protein n=1 Tax=Chitiniphilus shinanonensis TaxID=553088 RepID=UPI00302712C3